MLLPLQYLKNVLIIRYDPAKINNDDRFCFLRDSRFQCIIIHLRHMGDRIAVFLDIDKLDCSTTMNGSGSRCRVGISWNDHLVSRTNTQHAEVQLLGSRR